MNNTTHDARMTADGPSMARRSWKVAAVMLAVIGSFYLVREHWGHLGGSWIYLLLLACPLMHLMHGHGGHGQHKHHDAPSGGTPSSSKPG